MVPLNFMTTGKADYIVTGNFSNLAAKEAAKFGQVNVVASSKDKNFTYIPDVSAIPYDADASYIHICQNNTIFGTQYVELPQVDGIPLVADMSSMILSRPVDVTQYGCIYFGVQKNVAPAGMAIAIIREDLLGHAADTVPTMMNYTTLINKDSMYNTPPCTSSTRWAALRPCSRSTRPRPRCCMTIWTARTSTATRWSTATAAP